MPERHVGGETLRPADNTSYEAEWLLPGPGKAISKRLRLLGRAVVPAQAFLAARLLSVFFLYKYYIYMCKNTHIYIYVCLHLHVECQVALLLLKGFVHSHAQNHFKSFEKSCLAS